MSILVNIENYEAFYLDFLEGNLDEEQMRAFLQFLEQHPELKMEEDLPSCADFSGSRLDESFISGLKMFDASETITETNCEQFMIASAEEAIPATKQVELNDFLARRPHLKPEMELYSQTRFVADTSIVYPDKDKLKRGSVIPMHVRFAAVAASIVLVLMFIPWNNSPLEIQAAQMASLSVDLKVKAGESKTENPSITQTPSQTGTFNPRVQVKNVTQRTVQQAQENNNVATLQPRNAGKIESVSGENELVALNLKIEKNPGANEENTYLGLSEMKNPVPFLTNGIKSRFKQDVDLRTAKASKTKQGGFYLKIGKFEISRKTAPVNEDILAVNP